MLDKKWFWNDFLLLNSLKIVAIIRATIIIREIVIIPLSPSKITMKISVTHAKKYVKYRNNDFIIKNTIRVYEKIQFFQVKEIFIKTHSKKWVHFKKILFIKNIKFLIFFTFFIILNTIISKFLSFSWSFQIIFHNTTLFLRFKHRFSRF